MLTITTEDGYPFHRQPNGVYTDRQDGDMEHVDLFFGPICSLDRMDSLPEILDGYAPLELRVGCQTIGDFIDRYRQEQLSPSPLEQHLTDGMVVLFNIRSDRYHPETLTHIAESTILKTTRNAACESFHRLTGCEL